MTVSTTMKGYVITKQMLLARLEKSLSPCRHRGRFSPDAWASREGVFGCGKEGEIGEGEGGGIMIDSRPASADLPLSSPLVQLDRNNGKKAC